ncbi:sulfotransferase [Gloeothece verrucosa]|uniref:Sulfotransferase n=1 Tax=Gloeothece verrucosa (strain PCC 7822) TaxID=497965 RepID=E0U6U3_GLOV7|nr:sulfotransferase [Gloeothece verrucosa]ADN15980.1 sulfotransferase [Gloeothece verrucosa PCC 7822]
MIFPNFFILGTAQAGTMALQSYLQQHPQIYMTSEKINRATLPAKEFKLSRNKKINQLTIANPLDLPKKITKDMAIGTACPVYLYNPNVAPKIYEYCPQVRLIVILRHPVLRAYINFLHLFLERREPHQDFLAALQAESQRIQKHSPWFTHYIQLGFYGQQLKRYYQLFSPEQIKVYLYEDFLIEPLNILKDICHFLQVDPKLLPKISREFTQSEIPAPNFSPRFFNSLNCLTKILNSFRDFSVFQKHQAHNIMLPEMSLTSRKFLLDLYREDILQCQDLIRRDLSAWLKPDFF